MWFWSTRHWFDSSPENLHTNIMAKVRVIASTVRYGSNGFKHAGEYYNLPEAEAKEKADKGLVEILPEKKAEKSETITKELKEK